MQESEEPEVEEEDSPRTMLRKKLAGCKPNKKPVKNNEIEIIDDLDPMFVMAKSNSFD